MPNNYLSDTETSSALQALVAALTNDPNLYQSLLAMLPNKEEAEEVLLRFNESRIAAEGGDPQQALLLEAHRKDSNRTLSRFESLAKLAAEDDPTLPQRLGIKARKHKVKKAVSTAPLLAPGNFIVWHASEHGVMYAKASPVKKGRSYLIEICEGDPTIESNWRYAATSVLSSKMEIRGLTPGTVYWFRVRALGANSFGPWSSYVTLMAI